jgi:hypothetical protein
MQCWHGARSDYGEPDYLCIRHLGSGQCCLTTRGFLNTYVTLLRMSSLKGQCHEIFDFWFFRESVSPKPLSISLGPFRIFSKIRGDIRSSTCTTGVVGIGGEWKKSSIRKILIILFGHLWVEELTYIKIFAFKFTLRSLQLDIVPIICRRYRW